MTSSPLPPEGGPYRAEFGAVSHDDVAGFIFTVTPADYAPSVAAALNATARTIPALLEALRDARETILYLKNARWSECEGSDADWIGEIDAALALATGGEDGR